jgi:spermidine synthase
MGRSFQEFFKRMKPNEISLSEERGIRYLHFGSVWIQGAMRINDPFRLELDYTRELFAGLLFNPKPRRITLVGLGAASATKFAWKQFPKARVTTVEIDPAVILCARQHFALPADGTRLRTVCADGDAHLGESPDSCDYLIVDAYDAAAKGPVLSSPEFYARARAALTIDGAGVMAVNLFGKHASFQRSIRNIERAFDGRMLVLPASERGNVIAFGFTGERVEVTVAELRARASTLKETTGLAFARWLAGFRSANLIEGPVFKV